MFRVNLKELVKDTTAEFVCYRDGDLWYKIVAASVTASTESSDVTTAQPVRPESFEFPVPVADTGTGVFPARIKAITLMRWVRKHLERVNRGEWS